MTSMTGALAVFMAAIPKIIAFILILVIGWCIASLVAKGVAALLRTIKFNEIKRRGAERATAPVSASCIEFAVAVPAQNTTPVQS